MPLPGGYILDTNILLALVRGNALGLYVDATYSLTKAQNAFMISIVSVGEMYALVEKFKSQGQAWGPAKVQKLDHLLGQLVWIDLSDPAILKTYGEIDGATEAIGRKMGKNDVWIAATARITNATLLTTDTDFDHLFPKWIDREWVDPTSKLSA